MGGKDPNRQPRLSTLRYTPPGWIRLAACDNCERKAPIPIEALVRKHGELAMVEKALVGMRFSGCRRSGASALMVRLCDPGCHRWRG